MALDDFVSKLSIDGLIAADIDGLIDEFDVDAASQVAALKKQALDDARRDPRYQANATRVGQARVQLRQMRISVARRVQSNQVAEHRHELDLYLWDSRLVDFFVAGLQRDEKLIEVSGFELKTNMRSFSRDGLKRNCRMSSELNDSMYAKNFTSDAMVNEAVARATYREAPFAPGSTGISNSDWPPRR